jgi:hypothetical protein
MPAESPYAVVVEPVSVSVVERVNVCVVVDVPLLINVAAPVPVFDSDEEDCVTLDVVIEAEGTIADKV